MEPAPAVLEVKMAGRVFRHTIPGFVLKPAAGQLVLGAISIAVALLRSRSTFAKDSNLVSRKRRALRVGSQPSCWALTALVAMNRL